MRIGNYEVPSGLLNVITSSFFVGVLAYLLSAPLPDEIGRVVWLAVLSGFGVIYYRLLKGGKLRYRLGVSDAAGTRYPIWSKDEERLHVIAKAIKAAMLDRYASLQQAEPPSGADKPATASAL